MATDDDNRWDAHNDRHDLAAKLRSEEHVLRWDLHAKEHEKLAGIAAETERRLADRVAAEFEAHAREHAAYRTAHMREHELQEAAVKKVESTTETRFAGVNEFREQLRDQATRLASTERVDSLEKEVQRRFDEHRLAITNIEKGDVKGEGKSLGQGTVIAAIVGTVGFTATLIGIIVVLANVLTSTP